MTWRQWLECSEIANRCAAQFVGFDNEIAMMFARIAVGFQQQVGVWK